MLKQLHKKKQPVDRIAGVKLGVLLDMLVFTSYLISEM